jgi:hypothetical protein
MDIYDAHVHYLWRATAPGAGAAGFSGLQKLGLKGMALIVMGHHLSDMEKCFEFIPHSYHDKINRNIFANSTGMALPATDIFPGIDIFPYLDSRYITEVEVDLSRYRDLGYRGLKLLYVADEDRNYGMSGWPLLFGKTKEDFARITINLIEQAAAFGWPVIFHADLRLHEEFIRDILAGFTGHPFIFPHFGFSRKVMAHLLEEFDDCYTDFSSLLPFMQKAPAAYRNFLEVYSDRVLFGSDATCDWPDLIGEYIETVKSLVSDETLLKKIFQDNYLKIH